MKDLPYRWLEISLPPVCTMQGTLNQRQLPPFHKHFSKLHAEVSLPTITTPVCTVYECMTSIIFHIQLEKSALKANARHVPWRGLNAHSIIWARSAFPIKGHRAPTVMKNDSDFNIYIYTVVIIFLMHFFVFCFKLSTSRQIFITFRHILSLVTKWWILFLIVIFWLFLHSKRPVLVLYKGRLKQSLAIMSRPEALYHASCKNYKTRLCYHLD